MVRTRKTKVREPGRAPSNKGKRLPPEPLTVEECRALLRATSTRGSSGLRNRALIVVLWRAGLRCSEALALQPKDLDSTAGTIRVMHGKGDKSRLVAMDDEAQAVLGRWMERRASLGHNGRQPVFCTLAGGPIRTNYIRAMLARIGAKAGIEKRVHPHGLRHSFAVGLASEGVPVPVISAALGHSSIATTSTYLSHVAPRQVIDTLRARSW